MIRLTVILCVGLFVVLLIAGEDRGQVRQGLLNPPVVAEVRTPVAAVPRPTVVETEAEVAEAVFVPGQPVRVEPALPVPEPVLAEPAPVEDVAPPQPENSFAVVNATSVNVRAGPSTADSIIGRLSSGEQVLIVVEAAPVDGWNLVRIEGDGIEGYVASRLLTPLQ
jgi:hypothetical protein